MSFFFSANMANSIGRIDEKKNSFVLYYKLGLRKAFKNTWSFKKYFEIVLSTFYPFIIFNMLFLFSFFFLLCMFNLA